MMKNHVKTDRLLSFTHFCLLKTRILTSVWLIVVSTICVDAIRIMIVIFFSTALYRCMEFNSNSSNEAVSLVFQIYQFSSMFNVFSVPVHHYTLYMIRDPSSNSNIVRWTLLNVVFFFLFLLLYTEYQIVTVHRIVDKHQQ